MSASVCVLGLEREYLCVCVCVCVEGSVSWRWSDVCSAQDAALCMTTQLKLIID